MSRTLSAHFQVPYILFSPVGQGVYGHFVREELKKRGISSPIPSPNAENGCCYCFVEKSGERSFASYHGAEYLFEKSWFDLVDVSEIDSVYICGLEIEEKTGINIVEFLEKNPQLTVFFAPGPRLTVIDPALTERIYKLSPVLHLNETEALEVSGEADISKAGAYLYRKTHNTVIITLGEKGCYYYNGKKKRSLPPFLPSRQIHRSRRFPHRICDRLSEKGRQHPGRHIQGQPCFFCCGCHIFRTSAG